MVAPDFAFYPLFVALLLALLGPLHRTALPALADLVWALLVGQSLHPADLQRSLPHLQTTSARQAFRRVRRAWARSRLTSTQLTPRLLPAVLRFVSDEEVTLILDSTRCGNKELFTLGIQHQGRVLLVAWATLPYPWPPKTFTPTVVALLDRTLAAWPIDRPVHLLADRGFPSLAFFRCLDGWRARRPLEYTIRLRAGDWVRDRQGQAWQIRDLADRLTLGVWGCFAASYQKRRQTSALVTLVVGRGVSVFPAHQQGPADQARRAQRAARRRAHVASKRQSAAADQVWALLTTAPTIQAAKAAYRRRFATEGTYRDVKSWDLEAVVAHERDLGKVDGLVGVVAVTALIQTAIGTEAGRTSDETVRARQQQWCTTDRLSSFWRGRQVLHDRAQDWRPWLRTTLAHLTTQFQAPAARVSAPPLQEGTAAPPPPTKEAA
jgi:hypothetical protein